MTTPTIPSNELERQLKLNSYEILDSENEIDFDAITQIVARLLNVPICVISLIDNDRQWFKSKHGLDASETPRDISFCGHAINFDDVFVVENALEDVRFSDNPLVIDGPKIRFYAGAQLATPDGFNLGMICAIDDKPKEILEDDKKLLKVFAKNIMNMLELKSQCKNLKETLKEINSRNDVLAKQLSYKEHVLTSPKNISLEIKNVAISKTNLSSTINFVKNAVSNTFSEKSNKLIFLSSNDIFVDADETKLEFIFKYLFLAMNDFFKNEIFVIKPINNENSVEILIKNTLVVLWRNKNKLTDEQIQQEILMNNNYKKAIEFSEGTNLKFDFSISATNGLDLHIKL
ncbi:MAG: GAF domain-containing protein [Bacteroidetes bacterium]|nr:MAG: GAF domain-containing protein [Bacteroidota bacterium]